jgi:membrane protein implicated in regulation of membrane protease activity
MIWWLWVVVGFVLMAAETLHMALFLIFLGMAAVLVGVLARFGMAGPDWMQWLMFSAISVISVVLFRRPLLQYLRINKHKDVDTMIGETAKALEAIEVNGRGKAELRGSPWNAVNVGDKPLDKGEACLVERVDGITIKVRAE